jgi:hypothetical protein
MERKKASMDDSYTVDITALYLKSICSTIDSCDLNQLETTATSYKQVTSSLE